MKFDIEVLPSGTTFTLRMELEDTDENDERLLAVTLAEWQSGRTWIGGRVARGLGAFDLLDVHYVERRLASADDLLAFLRADAPWNGVPPVPDGLSRGLDEARAQVRSSFDDNDGIAKAFCTFRLGLQITSLFLTNDTMAAVQSGFDHVPLLDIVSTNGKAILAGSGLRGVLRSQAERIARTLTTLEVTDGDQFLAKCPACNPVESRHDGPLSNCDTLLRNISELPDEHEASDDQLCLACRLFGSTRRGSRFIVEDAEPKGDAVRKILDFLAIDRFTGGGKERAKFDALTLWRPAFGLHLHLDNPAQWELGWLWLVLRDLADGIVTVGFGAGKGFGRLAVEGMTVELGFLTSEDLINVTGAKEVKNTTSWSGLYRVVAWDTCDTPQNEQLAALAQGWVDTFHRARKAFHRADTPGAVRLPRLQRDSFFGTSAEELYEKAVML